MGCTVDLDIDALTDLALITGAGGQQLARTMAVTKNPILVLDAKRKSPVHFGRGWKSPIYLDIDSGTRPPDLNTRLSHVAALLDGYITVATSADGQVAVSVDAFFVAERSNAVFFAEPLGARWQRERGRTRHRDGDSKNMNCSHPLVLHGCAHRETRN
jgi:hypothetical protein